MVREKPEPASNSQKDKLSNKEIPTIHRLASWIVARYNLVITDFREG